jgi:hypothetical protein
MRLNNYESTKLTNNWLRENGIDPDMLSDLNVEILQAQMIATNILRHHGRLLEQNEAASLNNFLKASRNAKLRQKLTLTSCYKVMNLGAAVNRKLFKMHRQQKD